MFLLSQPGGAGVRPLPREEGEGWTVRVWPRVKVDPAAVQWQGKGQGLSGAAKCCGHWRGESDATAAMPPIVPPPLQVLSRSTGGRCARCLRVTILCEGGSESPQVMMPTLPKMNECAQCCSPKMVEPSEEEAEKCSRLRALRRQGWFVAGHHLLGNE